VSFGLFGTRSFSVFLFGFRRLNGLRSWRRCHAISSSKQSQEDPLKYLKQVGEERDYLGCEIASIWIGWILEDSSSDYG
jgi:hypothetical protein